MGILGYSSPRFELPGDDHGTRDQDGSQRAVWSAPVARAPLSARLGLPGSKSRTNRELVLSALAAEPTLLRAPLHSRDSALMVDALRSLGTSIEETGGGAYGPDLLVTPGELTGGVPIDCGLAGTLMRFGPPVAALALGPVTFDGDAAGRPRPRRTTTTSPPRPGAAPPPDAYDDRLPPRPRRRRGGRRTRRTALHRARHRTGAGRGARDRR